MSVFRSKTFKVNSKADETICNLVCESLACSREKSTLDNKYGTYVDSTAYEMVRSSWRTAAVRCNANFLFDVE